MGSHIEVDHLPPVMKQHDEAVQNIESHSRHCEEINLAILAMARLKRLSRANDGSYCILDVCLIRVGR